MAVIPFLLFTRIASDIFLPQLTGRPLQYHVNGSKENALRHAQYVLQIAQLMGPRDLWSFFQTHDILMHCYHDPDVTNAHRWILKVGEQLLPYLQHCNVEGDTGARISQ